ncbi:MAG: hypothetical protein U5N26_06740 [Candidatus Marinimicrobia bacterium]|nr:hypothetical protein [Candidatus Neomarinimicrobiota bacterium]
MVRSDKACIFLNGEPPGRDHIERYCEPAYLKICTDGAHDYLEAYGVSPHILIGDMDSLKELPSGSAFRILRSTDVNNSDFEKALGYCSDNGIRKLRIFGAGRTRRSFPDQHRSDDTLSPKDGY